MADCTAGQGLEFTVAVQANEMTVPFRGFARRLEMGARLVPSSGESLALGLRGSVLLPFRCARPCHQWAAREAGPQGART